MEIGSNCRVLSIQSHVVSGYAGNKSASFPLQLLGFEVDAINSVQFSNHTGYKCFKGQVLDAQNLDELFLGLKLNDLHKNYSHILTGYVNSKSFLLKIIDVVKEIKKANPNTIYVCDPVMGDAGKLYVTDDCLPVFRDEIVKLADILTPNQFEAELLTGIKIKSFEDALEAIDILHSKGIDMVFISSMEYDENFLVAIASKKIGQTKERVRIEVDRMPATFVGTGDLFSALLLAWLTKTQNNITLSFEKTIATLQAVLKRTYNWALNSGDGLSVANVELKLIQSKKDIEDPQVVLKCRPC